MYQVMTKTRSRSMQERLSAGRPRNTRRSSLRIALEARIRAHAAPASGDARRGAPMHPRGGGRSTRQGRASSASAVHALRAVRAPAVPLQETRSGPRVGP